MIIIIMISYLNRFILLILCAALLTACSNVQKEDLPAPAKKTAAGFTGVTNVQHEPPPAAFVELFPYTFREETERSVDAAVRVVVVGEVERGGIYYYSEPVTIKEAIAAAGTNRLSGWYNVKLVRGSGADEKRYSLNLKDGVDEAAQAMTVEEGDIIFIPRRLL